MNFKRFEDLELCGYTPEEVQDFYERGKVMLTKEEQLWAGVGLT